MGKVRLFLAASLMAAAAGFAAAQNRVPPGSNPYPFGVPAVQSRPATPPQPINPGHVQAAKNTPAQPPQQQLAYVPVYFVDPYWGDYGYSYWYPSWWRYGYTYPPVYLLPGTWFGWPAPQPGLPPVGRNPVGCRPRGTNRRRGQSRSSPSPGRSPGDQRRINRLGAEVHRLRRHLVCQGQVPRGERPVSGRRPERAQLADAYFRQGLALIAMGSYARQSRRTARVGHRSAVARLAVST